MATTPTPIAVAYGDGIGPEIMDATLRILEAAGAKLELHKIEIGEAVYNQGHSAGIVPEAWETLRKTKVFLKAPITTPQGGGFKSLNVTVRKTLGLYANVRPCVTYDPAIPTRHPGMDVVVVRENEEDLYAGIEHRQTDDVYQCLKLITRPGTEKIVRYAFEYAKAYGRKKVTCMTKDNIMKLTDGLFHKVFDEIGAEYPDIEREHWIIDIGMARAATRPEIFDVIVTPNLYGDILSDVTAETTGSVGLAGSANIGEHCAMFEAIHGSAPKYTNMNIANPSGLFLGGVMMLIHIDQKEAAEKAHNAWLKTLEDGIHTKDVYREATSKEKVGTKEFADAVIARIGQKPTSLKPVDYTSAAGPMNLTPPKKTVPAKREIMGVDVFVHWTGTPDELGAKTKDIDDTLELVMISNRGVKVWPNGMPETFKVDQSRLRYMSKTPMSQAQVLALLSKLDQAGISFTKYESLQNFDGVPGYSLGQGQ